MGWDDRYDTDEFVYGTEPNDFLRDHAGRLPPGRVLCLAEGEGRNAVWLASRGHEVTAVDASAVGLAKARRLADAAGVVVDFVHADLAEYDLGRGRWDGVVSIFCHLPPPLRRRVHAKVVAGLRPGGVLLLEGYTAKQLELKTGGPPAPELMHAAEDLRRDLAGLEFDRLEELERDVVEGSLHRGRGAVVQAIAVKP
jgi:SAM-dependent methyltransferase